MARTGRRASGLDSEVEGKTLTASAASFKGKSNENVTQSSHADLVWQKECYEFYRFMGEPRFAADYVGTALSTAIIGTEGGDEGAAENALKVFFGDDGEEKLKSVGVHFTVAGELFVVGRSPVEWEIEQNPALEGVEEIWEICSVEEISKVGGQWVINYHAGDPPIYLKGDDDEGGPDAVIRMWIPDAAMKKRATSPFQSLLRTMREIASADDRIQAMYSSRLTGNGLLMLPQGIDLPTPPGGSPDDTAADSAMRLLVNAARQAKANPGSAESQIPIVMLVPDELVDKGKHLDFFSKFDSETVGNRDNAIHRFARGTNLPAEKVLGISGQTEGQERGSNHWNVWAVDEETIKMHIEPMLKTFLSLLSVHFLQVLAGRDSKFTHNLKGLHLRPDRSKESVDLYNLGALSLERMLEENGFDPVKDKPTPEQYREWVLRKLATGSATPEQITAALKELGIELDIPVAQAIEQARRPDEGQQETPQPPSLQDRPRRKHGPDDDAGREAANLGACEGLVLRALERAGNKVLRKEGGRQGLPQAIDPIDAHCQFHVNGEGPGLIEDGFKYADRVLGETASVAVPALKSYCLDLFATGEEHSRARLAAHLEKEGV